MVEVGKEGKLFLLNRDNLGGKSQGAGGSDNVVQTLGPFRGLWGHPSVYGGEGGYVYFPQENDTLLAFKYGLDGQGNPSLTLAGNSKETFGYSAGSPLITSDGTTPGSAVLWIINVDGGNGANGKLCAYNAVPVNGVINLLRCFPIGTGSKFSNPATTGGRVYVGSRDGVLFGFGVPVAAALTLPPTSFGNVSTGQTSSPVTLTATAVRPVTVTGVTASAPFAVVNSPAFPVSLNAGDTLAIPMTFSPTAPGSITGVLNFAITENGVPATLGAALQGNAITPGFTGSPGTLTFSSVAVGSSLTLSGSFTNTGVSPETVTSATSSGPFTVTGLPTPNMVVAPGQAVNVSVAFTPNAVGSVSGSITVVGPDGTGTIALTANGVAGVKQLSISPASLTFGSVPVGLSATQTLTVTNSGNLNVTVTKAAPPALPFVVNTPLPEGLVLSPGDSVQVQVTFAPSTNGSFSNLYVISSDDGAGAHNVQVTGTGVSAAGGRALPNIVGGGGWVFNGSAQMSGSDLVLTQAANSLTGDAVFSTPVPSNGLRAAFTAVIGGGNGADGMTFSMLDAASNTPHSLGVGGGGLGFKGLTGVAVTLDTYKGGNDPSNNFIGLTNGSLVNGQLSYVATATNIPNLRSGTHALVVNVSGTKVTVSVDGTQVISATVAMPASVLPMFSGANGGLNDQHAVRAVAVTSGGTALLAPDDGWRFNGAASVSGSNVVLTPAQNSVAGTMLYARPVITNGLTASFNLSMNGGTGADGATFALLNPASTTPNSLGGSGGGLGFAGLAGVAVSFITYPQNGVNSHNFVGVMTSTTGGKATLVASSTNVPNLRSGSHNVVIRVTGTTIVLTVDGTQVLSTPVSTLTSTAIVGFTAATGGSNDVHVVSNAQILGTSVVPAPPAGGWQINGSATVNGGTVQLTPAQTNKTGTAINATAVPTAHLDAKFTIQIGGGNGADGLSFMVLDPATVTPTSVGSGGGGLGFQGLHGVAVCFITYLHTGYPSNNFVGISAGGSGGTLTFLSTTTAVPALRTGTHAVEVLTSAAGHLVVKVDGTQVLDTAATLPTNALVGFSGATGGVTDVHAVSNINITY
jgi:hypothetical protein